MQLDIYLGFTSCKGNCIFCRRGENIIEFPRRDGEYGGDDTYTFQHFDTQSHAFDWLENVFPHISEKFKRINVSGNDPIDWEGLDGFMKILREIKPQAEYTLRLSNTRKITKIDTLSYFHRFEFSLYADTRDLHNHIVGDQNAWNIFHENLLFLEKNNIKGKVFFQTIPLNENIDNLSEIIGYIVGILKTENPIKIIYPIFFPKATIKSSLISRETILISLIKSVPKTHLKKFCMLQNFPSREAYEHLFHSIHY